MKQRELSNSKFQIDALDGLRGFAALIVVLSHTSNSGLYFLPNLDFQGIGKSGVFLFFLLSSFLLSIPLIEKGKRLFDLSFMSVYWQRRFFRIYPLYVLYLLLAVASSKAYEIILERHGEGLPFFLDWNGLFEHLTLQEGKGVTWSIAVEFKFYFILPILCFFVAYFNSISLKLALFLLLVLFGVSQYISPQSESLVNDARLLPYLPVFLFGTLLALIQLNLRKRQESLSSSSIMLARLFSFIAVVGLCLMSPTVYESLFYPVERDHFHKQFILYSLFWSCILFSAVNTNGILNRFFCLPFLRFYGALSFSIYLFHPIFIFLVKRMDLNMYMGAWLVLALSTLASYVSFKLLEYPVSRITIKKGGLKKIFSPPKS